MEEGICSSDCTDEQRKKSIKQLVGQTVSSIEIIPSAWDIYKQPDFGKIKSLLKENVIFDGRNQYSLAGMKRQGFTYYSIGRAIVR